MAKVLTVDLGERSYPIHIGEDVSDSLQEVASRMETEGRRGAVLTDENLVRHQEAFLSRIWPGLPRFVVPAGETSKSLTCLQRVYDFLAGAGLDRNGMLWAFGGGVVGDLAGFAAATYLRGIEFGQVPTTLLAMVDSSVGGKTGVNLEAGKNLVGAFHQPSAVFISLSLMNTLPEREFNAGMGEVIKYALLADSALLGILQSTSRLYPGHPALPDTVHRCCWLKAEIVKADERETAASDGRALLNLGHTFAHAIEKICGYGELLHGEAVAIGLCLAARLSVRVGRLSRDEAEEVNRLVDRYNLPRLLPRKVSVSSLMDAMQRDKKTQGGRLRFVILEELGRAVTCDDINPRWVEEIWREAGAT